MTILGVKFQFKNLFKSYKIIETKTKLTIFVTTMKNQFKFDIKIVIMIIQAFFLIKNLILFFFNNLQPNRLTILKLQ